MDGLRARCKRAAIRRGSVSPTPRQMAVALAAIGAKARNPAE
jgi:hypothetical protein